MAVNIYLLAITLKSCKLMKSLFELVKVKQETLLNGITKIASYCCCLVAQLCPTLCHPMDCKAPLSIGFPRQEY